jgi:hypothetical protein
MNEPLFILKNILKFYTSMKEIFNVMSIKGHSSVLSPKIKRKAKS